jgi:crotonobetaine/carnitine-CoA ligase
VAVVRKPDTELEAEELVEFCTERMAAFMIPRYVDFRDQLPKTATERVQKYQLRDKGPAGAWDRLAESEGNR